MKRHIWVLLIVVLLLWVTVSISAELNYSSVFSNIGKFLKNWATDWLIPLATILIAYLTLKNVGVARSTLEAFRDELAILERTHRVEVLPLLEVNLKIYTELPISANISNQCLMAPELAGWGKAYPGDSDRYVIAEFANLQKNPAGTAFNVKFRAMFKFPIHPFGAESIELPGVFEGFWLRPEERWNVCIANLKGVPNATIDITEISYYDNDGLVRSRAYGFCRLQIPQVGEAIHMLKVFTEHRLNASREVNR